MINATELAAAAARGYPLALRDDPTAWSNPAPRNWLDIQGACNAVIRENGRSSIARAVGSQLDTILAALLVAAADDGPLADLPAVWREHVIGLDVDPSPVLETEDWEEQQTTLRQLVAAAIDAYPFPDCGTTLRDYVLGEPRLAAFHGAAPAAEPPPAVPAIDWDDADDFTPPAHVARAWNKPLGEDKAAPRKDATPAPKPQPAASLPKLPGLLHAAGMTDADVGTLFGVSRAYWNMVRSGKRAFNGIKPNELTALRTELEGRKAALDEALASLDDKAVTGPAGV